MAQASATLDQGRTGLGNRSTTGEGKDVAESVLRTIDQSTKGTTGISLFHILTLGAIGASIALFLSGKKQAGIFVGLWPPTFQALKSVADTNKEDKK
ncbi:MAG TPA: hypothetical protein VEV81_08185 [Pyrinomonadaceae bacterium]|nr:hypothetical protein [Pyrinomonadaceae bacterium]